jgi:hypothetical protein
MLYFQVFLFAIIFSLIIKNPGGDEEEDDDEEAPKKLDTDEEFLHEEEDGLYLRAYFNCLLVIHMNGLKLDAYEF